MRVIFPGFVQKNKVTKEFLYSKQSLSPSVSTEGLFFMLPGRREDCFCREGGKFFIAGKAGRLLLIGNRKETKPFCLL